MSGRADLKRAFLARVGWGAAQITFLAGDASDRSYDRLTQGGDTAIVMDAPPGTGDDPAQFVVIAAHLRQIGLSAPRVLAQDLAQGFLLLEDLGDDLFARRLVIDPAGEVDLYEAACDVLVHLQAQPIPDGLPDLSAADWAAGAAFAFDWYRFAITGDRVDTALFRGSLSGALTRDANRSRVLILRDYHAENLLWLPDRDGLGKVGLLDFQLAQAGQPGYDLVSLLQDARRDLHPRTEDRMIARFAKMTLQDEQAFRRSYAVLGAQRALRILGIFARLCLVAGKRGYLPLIPRVWDHLQRNLAQPGLEALAEVCSGLPPPTSDALKRIEAQCGAFR